MTDTYRALCAELVADYDDCHYRSELSDRAHAALAEPEPPDAGEVAELVAWLRCQKGQIPGGYTEFDRRIDRAADLLERIPVLEAELERERIRLAACGVIAMADTPDSATAARDIAPEYQSASAQDVARMVDKLMRLRQQPPPPTQTKPEPPDAGEVAELVVCLHRLARADWLSDETADILTRAADLLEQFSKNTSI